MDSLPTEIITHILKFLEPVDIQRASEVCFTWYQASMHPHLKYLFMGRKTRCNFAKVTFSQYKAECRSLDLTIEGHNKEKDLTWDNNNAQLDLGPEVKQLLLKIDVWISPYLTVIILNDILRNFTHLKMLTLKDMNMHTGFLLDGSLSVHLQSLQKLKLCFVGNILNFLQGPTMNLLPNKSHLCLENEVVLTNVEQTRQCNFARMISTLTLDNLKILCLKYPSSLTELNLINSSLTEEYTEKLCRVINIQMETLRLAKCSYVDDKALEILSNSSLKLKNLLIDGCKPNEDTSYVSTSGIEVVARKMKSLENLSFYLRDKVQFNCDTFSIGFVNLSSLSLMSYGEHHEYCTINLHNRNFNAAHLCKLDSPILLASLAKGSPMLQELSLDLICEISDNDVLHICKVFPHLSVLKLNSVCEVTDKALVGIKQYRSYKKAEKRMSQYVNSYSSDENEEDGGMLCHTETSKGKDQSFSVSQESRTLQEEWPQTAGQPITGSISVETAAHPITGSISVETAAHPITGSISIETAAQPITGSISVETAVQPITGSISVETDITNSKETPISDRDLPEGATKPVVELQTENKRPRTNIHLPVNSYVYRDLADCPVHNESISNRIIDYSDNPRSSVSNEVKCKACDCHRGLQELEYLQTLNLVGCCELTNKGFTIGLIFHNLFHLKLTHCDNLTDSGITAIVTNNPTIKTFVLEFCNMLSDDSVRRVVEDLKNLEKLKFDNCLKLTSACLMYVTISNTLQEVWFGSCNIPIANIEHFKESTTIKYHDFDW